MKSIGAARELYEETGIDIRCTCLDRLQPIKVIEDSETYFKLKKRLFFVLQVNDDDFYSQVGSFGEKLFQ